MSQVPVNRTEQVGVDDAHLLSWCKRNRTAQDVPELMQDQMPLQVFEPDDRRSTFDLRSSMGTRARRGAASDVPSGAAAMEG